MEKVVAIPPVTALLALLDIFKISMQFYVTKSVLNSTFKGKLVNKCLCFSPVTSEIKIFYKPRYCPFVHETKSPKSFNVQFHTYFH